MFDKTVENVEIFRPRRIRTTQTIATDDSGRLSVCQFASLSVVRLHVALLCENAEQIDVLFGVEIPWDPRNVVFDGSPDFLNAFDAALDKLLWPLVLQF